MRKGEATRARVLDDAIRLASVEGIAGLTIGRLAERAGMSKAGLFAHFKSKEEVEVAVLEEAVTRFTDDVFMPALSHPRGEPRLRALIDRWFAWSNDDDRMPGGCLIFQASVELDDQPGRARDVVEEAMSRLLAMLERAAELAIETGHFRRETDAKLVAVRVFGTMLATHQMTRMLRDPEAEQLMWRAVDALFAELRPVRRRARTVPRKAAKKRD
jgi:AcrR family transcriptional regulator